MAISKVIYGGETLIDLTADTVTKDKVIKGYTTHGADGEPITGTCDYDANTQDATATEAEMLSGVTAYNKGVKITGKMPNHGRYHRAITSIDGTIAIPQGYHDGSGSVVLLYTEIAKIKPENIRQGVTILYWN